MENVGYLEPGYAVLVARRTKFGHDLGYVTAKVSRTSKSTIWIVTDKGSGEEEAYRRDTLMQKGGTGYDRNKIIIDPIEVQETIETVAATKARNELMSQARNAVDYLSRNLHSQSVEFLKELVEKFGGMK